MSQNEIHQPSPEATLLPERAAFPPTRTVRQGALEVIVTQFADRWVVFASEMGKIGSVCTCSRTGQGEAAFEVEVHLGDREDMWTRLLARQVAERARKDKPIVLLSALRLQSLESDAARKAKVTEVLATLDALLAAEKA